MSRTRRGISILRGFAWASMVLIGMSPPVGAAPDQAGVEMLTGWEGDSRDQGYGYAGPGWLVPVGPRLIIPLRVLGSYLYYNFESGGTKTTVRSPGVTLMMGIRLVGSRGNFTMLGGAEVRDEHRETENVAGAVDRSTSGVVLQVDGDTAIGKRWRGYLFANYGGATRYLYGRTAMRYQVTNLDWKRATSTFVGLEGVRQGNDESDAAQGGGFMEWNFVAHRISLTLHGGYKESWSPGEHHHRGSYIGIGLYHRF